MFIRAFQQFLTRAAQVVQRLTSRSTARTEVSASINSHERINLGELPPFSGTPEEALIFMQLPPVAKVRQRLVVRLGGNGSVPDSVEEVRLTPFGKVIARTDFMAMDTNLQIGRPEDLKGCCYVCQGFSFRGAPCAGCACFTCAACGRQVGDDPAAFFCPRCLKVALASYDNWAAYDGQREEKGTSDAQ